jgi:hypothetical protein
MTRTRWSSAAAFLLLLALLGSSGCEKKLDRLISADGSVVAGRLESVQGGTIVFVGAPPVTAGTETAMVFLREGGSMGGSVSVAEGVLTISGRDTRIPMNDVEMVVWADPSYEEHAIIEVPARDGWVSSGIAASRGDMLSVSASGTVSMETGTCGPEGLSKFSTTTALFPGATNGQLILSVGESIPIAAGSLWTGPSPDSGLVCFAVNLPEEEPSAVSGGVYTVSALRSGGPGEGSFVLYPVKR